MKDPRFTSTLLQWYAENGRDLPWRRTRDPYAVWISEIILQQTRIAQGRAYWERFMTQFPDVEKLAGAEEDEVLRAWQGLGYYSRARNLLQAARQIVRTGSFPDTMEGLRALKGVGDYTAAAIGSIAFGLQEAVVDGNVYRVLARYYGIDDPVGSGSAKKRFTRLANELLPEAQAGTFNQAMMDFGALQCTPVSPDCAGCPLAGSCAAFRDGRVDQLPLRPKKTAVKERWFSYVYLRCEGWTAIRRRPAGDIWQGLWEPLLVERETAETPLQLPFEAEDGTLCCLQRGVKHQLTHRTIHADFYLLETTQRPCLSDGYRWVREEELGAYAKSRLFVRLLEAPGLQTSSE